MVTDIFEEPDDPRSEWVDVRMTDPDEGEWDVDVVVVGGQVEYVDLRVRPGLLAEFVDCLIDDVGPDRADEILATVADRQDVDLGGAAGGGRSGGTGEERSGGTGEE